MWQHPHRLAYERLVRRVLSLPRKPAVISLHYSTYWGMLDRQGAPRYYFTSENDFAVVAGYYNLPTVSFREALWPLILANRSGYLVQTGAVCDHPIGKDANPFCVRTLKALKQAHMDMSKVDYAGQLYSGGRGGRAGLRARARAAGVFPGTAPRSLLALAAAAESLLCRCARPPPPCRRGPPLRPHRPPLPR